MSKYLNRAWSRRLNLYAEGSKLYAEGNKLSAEGSNLYAEGSKLRAEVIKLRAEGDKLWAEGDKLWAEAILETYGNVKVSWSWETEHGECTLENGNRYDVDQNAETEPAE